MSSIENSPIVRCSPLSWFWPSPAPAGWKSGRHARQVLVWSDHAPDLAVLQTGPSSLAGMGLCVIRCGGFSPREAAALGLISRSALEEIFPKNSDAPIEARTVYIPVSWAAMLDLHSGESVGANIIRICADIPQDAANQFGKSEGIEAVQAGSDLALRIWLAIRLVVGQTPLIGLPLWLVFGWKVAAVGLASIWCAALLLAFVWRLVPLKAWGKGMIWGCIFAILLAFAAWMVLGIHVLPLGFLALAGGLLTFWMAVVFNGLQVS